MDTTDRHELVLSVGCTDTISIRLQPCPGLLSDVMTAGERENHWSFVDVGYGRPNREGQQIR